MSKDAAGTPRKIPAKILVTNVSQKRGGAGKFLDPGESYGNKVIG